MVIRRMMVFVDFESPFKRSRTLAIIISIMPSAQYIKHNQSLWQSHKCINANQMRDIDDVDDHLKFLSTPALQRVVSPWYCFM